VLQRPIHCGLYVLGPREEDGALADRKVGSSLQAVLSGPGIDGFEQDLVRLQDISVRKTLDRGEALEGRRPVLLVFLLCSGLSPEEPQAHCGRYPREIST
jgi:hypothetical protein